MTDGQSKTQVFDIKVHHLAKVFLTNKFISPRACLARAHNLQRNVFAPYRFKFRSHPMAIMYDLRCGIPSEWPLHLLSDKRSCESSIRSSMHHWHVAPCFTAWRWRPRKCSIQSIARRCSRCVRAITSHLDPNVIRVQSWRQHADSQSRGLRIFPSLSRGRSPNRTERGF